MSDTSIIIYGPKGPERHTRANARDLVYTGEYTWTPGLKLPPTAFAPYVTFDKKDGSISQEVLDKVAGEGAAKAAASGANIAAQQQAAEMQALFLAQQQAAAAAAVVAAPPVVVADFSAPPMVDTSDLDNDDEGDEGEGDEGAPEIVEAEEAATTPAPRRGRPRKTT